MQFSSKGRLFENEDVEKGNICLSKLAAGQDTEIWRKLSRRDAARWCSPKPECVTCSALSWPFADELRDHRSGNGVLSHFESEHVGGSIKSS